MAKYRLVPLARRALGTETDCVWDPAQMGLSQNSRPPFGIESRAKRNPTAHRLETPYHAPPDGKSTEARGLELASLWLPLLGPLGRNGTSVN